MEFENNLFGIILVPDSSLTVVLEICQQFNIHIVLERYLDCNFVFVFHELDYCFVRFICVRNGMLPAQMFLC